MTTPVLIPAVNREPVAESIRLFVIACLPGKELEFILQERKRRRSDEQNRYWWGVVIKTFCDHLDGWEPEDVHTYLCGEHFGWEHIDGLGRTRVKPIRRSSKLNKAEFGQLVERAQRIGAQHGIYVPDADPHYHLNRSLA